MFKRHANEKVGKRVILSWLLMSFFAGYMNATAFLGLGMFATHVTGFATFFGVSVAQRHFGNAATALCVPFFFLMGSIFSGIAVEGRVRRHKPPHYDYTMYACTAFLLVCVMMGDHRNEGSQAYEFVYQNFVQLSLISLVSGLANAALSYSSGTTLRVTHLTGVTTDLGRGIAEMIMSVFHKVHIESSEMRLNAVRVLTIVAFASGSVAGAYAYLYFSFKGLLFPAVFFLYAGFSAKESDSNGNHEQMLFFKP